MLTVGEKPVFRQYVAMLQRTFDPAYRDIMAFLEPNELPPVDPEGFDLDAIRKEREATRRTEEEDETTTRTTTTTEAEDENA